MTTTGTQSATGKVSPPAAPGDALADQAWKDVACQLDNAESPDEVAAAIRAAVRAEIAAHRVTQEEAP